MPHLKLSLSPGARDLLDLVVADVRKRDKTITPQRWCFLELRTIAGHYGPIQAALEAKGRAVIPAPNGAPIELAPTDLPVLPLEEGEGDLDLFLGPKLAARLAFCASANAAANRKAGIGPAQQEWKTAHEWAENYVTDALVRVGTDVRNRELLDEEKELESQARLEAERARRRSEALSQPEA